jgi:hypothetical protein
MESKTLLRLVLNLNVGNLLWDKGNLEEGMWWASLQLANAVVDK